MRRREVRGQNRRGGAHILAQLPSSLYRDLSDVVDEAGFTPCDAVEALTGEAKEVENRRGDDGACAA